MKIRLILTGVALLVATAAWAQPTGGTMGGVDILVVDKYKAKVREAVKITGQPEVKDTTVQPLPVNIRVRPRFAVPKVQLEPIQPVSIGKTRVERMPKNYVRMGVGNYGSPEFALAVGAGRTTNASWALKASHQSTATGVPQDTRVFRNNASQDNRLQARWVQNVGSVRMSMGLEGQSQMVSFYGVPLDSALNLSDTANRAPQRWMHSGGGEWNIEPLRTNRRSVFYGVQTEYRFLYDAVGSAQEHRARLAADFRKPVGNVELLLPLSASFLDLKQSFGTTRLVLAEFAPSVADTVGILSFTAGFKAVPAFRQSPGTAVPAKLYVFPNIKMTVPLVKNVINIQGGYVGSVLNTGWGGLLAVNPWISELTNYRESSETRLYGGLTGRITGRLSYQVGAAFVDRNFAAQFYREAGKLTTDSGRIHVEYVNWTNFQQRAELAYQHPIGLEVRSFYERNGFKSSGGTLYHLPAYEAGINALLNLKGKVRLESDLRWVGPRNIPSANTEPGQLPSYLDWRLGVYYQYNKQLQAYANGTNLLNQPYALWQGYTVQGIRGVLGLSYKF
jgi:hypothetical protein